jgi:hypothetical protein
VHRIARGQRMGAQQYGQGRAAKRRESGSGPAVEKRVCRIKNRISESEICSIQKTLTPFLVSYVACCLLSLLSLVRVGFLKTKLCGFVVLPQNIATRRWVVAQ